MISGEFYAIAAAICWSMAAVFYKKGIGVGAIPAVLIRTFFAMVFLLILFLILRGGHFEFTLMGFIFLNLGGLFRLILGGAAYMKGLENISVSRFIPILFTFPLLTILLSALLLNEKIRIEVAGGTLLIVIGIWILSRGKGSIGEKNIKFGVSMAVVAAFLYAFSIVATKTGLRDVDPFQSALISMPVPLLLLYIYYSANNGAGKIFKLKKEAYILLGLGGIAGMGFGSYFFFVSLIKIGAAKATGLAAITPALSSIIALFTLKEKINMALITGTVATIAGIWIIL
ncbi:MAG: DMT family transporter [Candidatus Methanoperedens sp.]|nr:DMT family transporter [Candidatus Methanoperedens sp.]